MISFNKKRLVNTNFIWKDIKSLTDLHREVGISRLRQVHIYCYPDGNVTPEDNILLLFINHFTLKQDRLSRLLKSSYT